jgi:hypothetical protein
MRLKVFIAFLLGFAVTIAVVVSLPTSRDERYAVLSGDAGQLTRIYARITTDPKPIDIAFIGSSRTMYGVDDKTVEDGLARAGVSLNVVNLGVPWPGRDLEVLLAKLLFTYKSPDLIVLELDQYEAPYGHFLLPYVGDMADMFCCRPWLNYRMPLALLAFARRRLLDEWAWFTASPPAQLPASPTHTFVPMEGAWDPRQTEISHTKARQDQGVAGALKQIYVHWASPFGLAAVREIVDQAADRGTRVAFLYLPARHYLTDGDLPENASFYGGFGPILRVPRDIAELDHYWFDWAHLNASGAERLTPFLVDAIAHFDAARTRTESARLDRDQRSGAIHSDR